MRIRRLNLRDKLPFLAFFLAVSAMNLASNSYVVRFSIGQMFFMVLAYIESRGAQEPQSKKAVANTTPSGIRADNKKSSILLAKKRNL